MGRIVSLFRRELVAYLGRISSTWTDFWFTPRDPFALCVMRCLVGWMAFYSTFVWGIDIESFLFPHGYNSAEMVSHYLTEFEGPFALSFWFWVPVGWIYPIHYLCLAITFCFMIGLYTRVTSVMSFIILVSYAYRARFSNYGLDQILTILTLYLCLAPSGAYLSVDRLIQRYRGVRKSLAETGRAIIPTVQPTVMTNLATRFTQFHYCVIYLAAGTGKLFGESWWDGSAMWRSLANAEYQTLDMTWMAYIPYATMALTHLTIYWEVSFAFLVWRPLTRPVVLLLGLGMHFGIGLFMGMWTFATCMMFGYLAFVEPQMVKACFTFLKESLWPTTVQEVPVNLASPEEVQAAAWKKAWDGSGRWELQAYWPEDQTSPVPQKTKTIQHPFASIVVLHPTGTTLQDMAAAFQSTPTEFLVAHSLTDLQQTVEDNPTAGLIVNLQGLSDQQVQEFLGTVLTYQLKDRPSVTLLSARQAKWLADAERAVWQKVVLLPCEADDVQLEYQRAVQTFNRHQHASTNEKAPAKHHWEDSVLA